MKQTLIFEDNNQKLQSQIYSQILNNLYNLAPSVIKFSDQSAVSDLQCADNAMSADSAMQSAVTRQWSVTLSLDRDVSARNSSDIAQFRDLKNSLSDFYNFIFCSLKNNSIFQTVCGSFFNFVKKYHQDIDNDNIISL